MGAPYPSVRVGVLAHRCGGAETNEIEAMPAGVLDAGRRVSRVPQWRIGLLQRMQFDRDVPVLVMRPGEAQSLLGEAGKQDRQCLVEHRARVLRMDSEVAQLVWRYAAPDAKLQTTPRADRASRPLRSAVRDRR